MNGDGKLELEIMLRVANSAQLQTLGEVEVDIMASLRERADNGVSVQLTALHANMALGRVLREIANRVDPPRETQTILVKHAPAECIEVAIAAIGTHDAYTLHELERIVDVLSSRFPDGDGAQFALMLRNTANAVHPLRITRASVELVARELFKVGDSSRVEQTHENPLEWEQLSEDVQSLWCARAERVLAKL